MNTTRRNCRTALLAGISLMTLAHGLFAAGQSTSEYFTIQVVDRQTGRGVPLVELRTTNSIRLFTDSNGIVAFREPGLMDREVFFFVESHGYEVPKDGFGYRGVRFKTTPGEEAVVRIDRLNIAERLYRVTGQGIYRDSVLTGRPVPLKNPVLNGQVMGQDSVDTCLYHGRLFWIWGDTGKPSYPLGHFATAGAVSDLPGHGGLDPAVGVNLEYFVDADSFSRPLCRLKEPGLVWLDGLLTVPGKQGRERMVARFARLKDLGHCLERGLVVFNDATQSFEPVVRTDPDGLPHPDFGHAFRVTAEGRDYYYFALPFPLTVRMRVEATWGNVIDPNRYEVLTAAQPDFVERASPLATYRWVRFSDLIGKGSPARTQAVAALQREKKDTRFYDVESGKAITPHGGSVYHNAHRRKWIAIFVQAGGASSYLGEVWYAEADTPIGPWAYACKVATHNKYSFYNPKQHPYFDQNGGRTIYFEGTYSWTFSGSEERATPRYDYNQIMYRLNLDDPRLVLPVPVYQVRGEGIVERGTACTGRAASRSGNARRVAGILPACVEGVPPSKRGQDALGTRGRGRPRHVTSRATARRSWQQLPTDPPAASLPTDYLMGSAVARADKWESVESVAFYAIEPSRATDGLLAVYADRLPDGDTRLRIKPPGAGAKPLFYALPSTAQATANTCIVPLYEYRHASSGRRHYSTQSRWEEAGWSRQDEPLCQVYRTPPGPLLLDGQAKPAPLRQPH